MVDEKRVIIAIAKTGMVCYDYQIKKICAIPEVVVEKLKA
jgi:acyl-CoA thioesterase FadM